MEQLHFSSFLYRYRCRSKFCAFSYPLYLLPFSHFLHFQKRLKNLNILVSLLLFIDDGLLISQEKSFEKSNAFIFCSYSIILFLLKYFGLALEYEKSEVFYFFRLHGYFNTFFLNLSHLEGPIFCLKDNWRYHGFIFDRKLLFQQHVKFYSNKALSTVKCIKMLENSMRGLLPHQKRLLYRTYILPITLYRFLL